MIQLLQTLKFKSLSLVRLSIIFCFLFTTQKITAQNKVVCDTVISFYIIKSGDNLTTIASRNAITLGFLCRINGYKNSTDFKLNIGNKIKIPKLVNRVVQQTLNDTLNKEAKPELSNIVKTEPKLSFADSIINHKAILQHKEDSLFLIYVELDKKKERIVSSNDSIILIDQLIKQQEDSIKAFKIDLAQKDSINKHLDFLIIENEEKQLTINSMNEEVYETYNNIRNQDSLNTYNSLHAKDIYVSVTNEYETTGKKTDNNPVKPKIVKQSKESMIVTKHQAVSNDRVSTDVTKSHKNLVRINKITQVSRSQHKKNALISNAEKRDLQTMNDSIDLNTIDKIQNNKSKIKYKIGDVIKETDLQKSSFLLIRAMKAIDAKDYSTAQNYLNKSLHLNPNYTEAYIMLADMYATFNYYDKAVKEYDKAIITNKSMPILYYNRGSNYLKMNELSKSFTDFNKAIQLDSQYVLALGGRASIYILKKNYKQAIADLTSVIELNAFFSPAYKARAEARLAIGDYKGTIEDCNKFIETNAEDAYVYYQRGMARINEGEFYNSCIDLLKAVELGYTQANLAIKKYCK
ncbi:MAG: tetratricopeptide repeat protein [Bacteroidota bacterium]